MTELKTKRTLVGGKQRYIYIYITVPVIVVLSFYEDSCNSLENTIPFGQREKKVTIASPLT